MGGGWGRRRGTAGGIMGGIVGGADVIQLWTARCRWTSPLIYHENVKIPIKYSKNIIKNLGGNKIPKNAKKNEDSEGAKKVTKGKRLEESESSVGNVLKTNKSLKLVILLQIIVIVVLVVNIVLLQMGFFSKEAIIDAGKGIELDIESVGESSVDYSVKVSLKNTGNKLATVSVTGEVYISEMYSATGDEMTKVLDYKYVEIAPGKTKNLVLGTFTDFEDWHYVVRVHIAWNGGSLELAKMLIPSP